MKRIRAARRSATVMVSLVSLLTSALIVVLVLAFTSTPTLSWAQGQAPAADAAGKQAAQPAQGPASETANPAAQPAAKPWMNTALEPSKRAELLVKEMTLDEKLSQIHMMDSREHPRLIIGIERLDLAPFKITNGPVGAGPGDSRTGQPATALPSALALSSTWDPELAATYGRIAAQEATDRGDNLLEAPGSNILRRPQHARNVED